MRIKCNPRGGNKFSQNIYLTKNWYPKLYKELLKVSNKNKLNKWVKDLYKHPTKEYLPMPNKNIKSC
jgi:hypothetical protein